MKRRTRFGFFGFLTMDCRAVEAYLDRMAGEGWALAQVWLGLVARFRRTDRTDLHYYVSVADPLREDDPVYKSRCTDCGWEKFGYVRYMNLYRSLPGKQTTPIHPDRMGKMDRDCGNVARWCVTCAVALALLVVLQVTRYLLIGVPTVATLLRLSAASGTAALILLFLPFALAGGAVYLFFSTRRLVQWRLAAQRDEPYPTPRLWAARLRSLLTLLIYLASASLVISFFIDLVALPTGKPLLVLGAATGLAFAVIVAMGRHRGRQPRRVKLWRCTGIAAFLLLAALGRGAFAPAFDAIRADSAAHLPTLEEKYDRMECYSTLVLSYARGSFDRPRDGKPRRPAVVVEYYDCHNERMADNMARALWSWDMAPMAGQTDVWEGRKNGRYDVLSRRGDIVRMISLPDLPSHASLREELLAWVILQ